MLITINSFVSLRCKNLVNILKQKYSLEVEKEGQRNQQSHKRYDISDRMDADNYPSKLKETKQFVNGL